VLSAANVANAIKFVVGPEGWAEPLGFNASDPTWEQESTPLHVARALAPKRQQLKQRITRIPNSKSVKLRYGPFTVPAPKTAGGEGMLWNNPSASVEKPCSKCLILGMNAGLEYPEGGDANTDTMMWLHHMVLFAVGTGAWDATCTSFGLPHMIVGASVQSSERIFSSGNERTIAFFNPPAGKGAAEKKVGYPVIAADRFGLITDLMNMNPASKSVYMTMYYDYVEDNMADWDHVKPVWFDVAQCGTSEIGGGTAGSNFKISALPWTANFDGEVLAIGGHIHDGGINVDVLANGKVACTSKAIYGTNEEAKVRADIIKAGGIPPATFGGKEGGAHADMGKMSGHSGGQHIIAMTVCGEATDANGSPNSPLNVKTVSKGQTWTLNAYYDYKQHQGMKNNYGGMDNVMGISIMFVKAKNKRTGFVA